MHTISYEFNSLFWLVYIQMLVGMVDSDTIYITIEYKKHFLIHIHIHLIFCY